MNPATGHSPSVEAAEEDFDTVKAILHAHLPGREVWAFGSRARRCAKPYSDLDLVIMGDESLSLDVLAALNEAFAESDLPWKVDVVDWARMSDAFRRIVEQGRVVLQGVEEAGNGQHPTGASSRPSALPARRQRLPAKPIHCITLKQHFRVLVERYALNQRGCGVWYGLR